MGLQTQIWKNNLRILYLIALFPLIFYGVMYWVFVINNAGEMPSDFVGLITIGNIILLVWLLLSIWFQKSIVFKFSGAKPLTRKENPRIYNIVENLAISRGMPLPKIGIIEDGSMNAFATGWSQNSSWVVFSRGIMDRLNDDELEAVAGHELTHIQNSDVKVMVIITCFIGIIVTLGEILIRSNMYKSRDNNKNGNQIVLLGIVLLVLGYLVFPLINLAVSRQKEYLADAGSVQMTKKPQAMIDALKKISTDARIESITKQNIANMCIANPMAKHAAGFMASISGLFSTHPPIDKRIKILQQYV